MCDLWKAKSGKWQAPDRRMILESAIYFAACVGPLVRQVSSDDTGNGISYSHLISKLSEKPSGSESADNLMTNEDSIASVLDQVEKDVPKGLVYLGVGPDQNFSLMSYANPGLAFLIDYRKKNQLLHLYHKALMDISKGRLNFLENFWARHGDARLESGEVSELLQHFKQQPIDLNFLAKLQNEVQTGLSKYSDLSSKEFAEIRKIQARLAGPGPETRFLALKMYPTIAQLMVQKTRSGREGHWLANDNLFNKIKKMQQEDRVFPLVGNWTSKLFFDRFSHYLTRKNLRIGLIYISDVEFFLLRNGLFEKYIENLIVLPLHPEALIVRTSTREISHPERIPGQSSTSIVRRVSEFLQLVRSGKIQKPEDLFA